MAGKKKETFDDRLRIHYDELKWLYMELYGNDDMFGELCEQMRWYDGQRKPALKKLDQKEARVRAAYENGIDTLEEYRENRERIRQERERLQKLLAAAQSPQPAPPRELVLQRIRTVLELLQDDQADSEAKGSMLRSIVEDIVVDKPHDRLVFHLYIQG